MPAPVGAGSVDRRLSAVIGEDDERRGGSGGVLTVPNVISLIRQASGNRDYDNRFGVRQRGRSPYATMLDTRFKGACRRYGIGCGRYRETLDCTAFVPPGQHQMALGFD